MPIPHSLNDDNLLHLVVVPILSLCSRCLILACSGLCQAYDNMRASIESFKTQLATVSRLASGGVSQAHVVDLSISIQRESLSCVALSFLLLQTPEELVRHLQLLSTLTKQICEVAKQYAPQ